MALENIIWKGEFNLYARVLGKLKTGRDNGELPWALYETAEGIYTELSRMYAKNRPDLYFPDILEQLDTEVGSLHDRMKPLSTEYFWFRDDECLKITELVEGRLSQDGLSRLSSIAFTNWGKAGKLGDPGTYSFSPDGQRIQGIGIPHINNANDLFARDFYLRCYDKIRAGEDIYLLDFGAGTGGTTEAFVHWMYTLAGQDGIPASDIRLHVTGVEFNHVLAEGYRTKARLLMEKYKGVDIQAEECDMVGFCRTLPPEHFDGMASSYAMHHLTKEMRLKMMETARPAIKQGGVFYRADPVLAMSEINRRLFNLTDEGTCASFDCALAAVENFYMTGFTGVNMLRGYSRLCDAIPEDVAGSLIMDERVHKGYAVMGLNN